MDGGAVLLVAEVSSRGRSSGVEMHGVVVWLYHFRRGKIAAVVGYASRAEALKAVGLEE